MEGVAVVKRLDEIGDVNRVGQARRIAGEHGRSGNAGGEWTRIWIRAVVPERFGKGETFLARVEAVEIDVVLIAGTALFVEAELPLGAAFGKRGGELENENRVVVAHGGGASARADIHAERIVLRDVLQGVGGFVDGESADGRAGEERRGGDQIEFGNFGIREGDLLNDSPVVERASVVGAGFGSAVADVSADAVCGGAGAGLRAEGVVDGLVSSGRDGG